MAGDRFRERRKGRAPIAAMAEAAGTDVTLLSNEEINRYVAV